MDDELLQRIRRFRTDYFPQYQGQFQELVDQGQHPTMLFIGCSDSRLLPYMLTGSGPGELFIVRNVGALIPPYNGLHGLHGTAAAIEYAVLNLHVSHIVVCGHSHCGAMKALNDQLKTGAPVKAKMVGAAQALAAAAREQPRLFPAGSGPTAGVPTDALPNIWTDRATFDGKMAKLIAESGKLISVVNGGNLDAIRTQAKTTGATCAACHRQFRADR